MSEIIAQLMAKMKAPAPELVAEAARQAANDRAIEDRALIARLEPVCGALGEGIRSFRRQNFSDAEIAYALICAAMMLSESYPQLFCRGMLRQHLALVTLPLSQEIRQGLRR